MSKVIFSIILGVIGLISGPFGVLPSGIGLFLGIKALKLPSQEITMPYGLKGEVGGKDVNIKPVMNSKWPVYIAVGINGVALFLSLLAWIGLGLFGGLFLFSQNLPK